MTRTIKRALAALLSSTLVLLSAGLRPYEALAADFAAPAAPSAPSGAVPMLGAVGLPTSPALGVDPALGNPALNVPSLDVGQPSGASIDASRPIPAPAIQAATPIPGSPASLAAPIEGSPAAVAQPAQSPSLTIVAGAVGARLAAQHSPVRAVSVALQSGVPIASAAPGAAYGSGREIEAAMTGQGFERRSDEMPSARFTSLDSSNQFFAKPAGEEIRLANDAMHAAQPQAGGGAPVVPAPPSNGGNGGNGGFNGSNGSNGGNRVPVVAKILSALVAVVPAAFLGWPLLATSLPLGVAVLAGSLAVAAFPFMSAGTPKLIRSIPGAIIAAGGLAALGLGVATAAAPMALVGAMAALGGWGMIRFARNAQKWQYMDQTEVLFTFLGALSAVGSIGLAALGPAGAAVTALRWVAYPASLALFMQLPGWVGRTISNTLQAAYLSVQDVYGVATSARKDTTLYRRLVNYSEAAFTASSWNALWLGLFVWAPIVVVEAAQVVIGAAMGLAVSALRAPVMIAWTLSNAWSQDSGLTKLLAAEAHLLFNVSKVKTFNPLEKPLLPWADSDNIAKRAVGALGIRLLQTAWLAAAPVMTAGLYLVGWPKAVAVARQPQQAGFNDPRYISTEYDPLPSQVPPVAKPASAPGSTLARLMASAIGLGAFAVFTLPVIQGAGLLGILVAGTSVAVALMPLLRGKAFAGTLMTASGVFAALGAARWALIGLPGAGVVATFGVLAALSGFGLRNLVSKLTDPKTKIFDSDNGLYALGYVGALGLTTALSLVLGLASGPVALGLEIAGGISSLALLAHLPKYLWQGLGQTIEVGFHSIGAAFSGFGYWTSGTRFTDNLTSWMGGIIRKYSVFVAPALLPLFIPLVLGYAATFALSLSAGAAMAVLHAPLLYPWAASYNKDAKSTATRFWSGLNAPLYAALEGSRKSVLQRLAKPLIEAANDAAPSRRPTLKALLALSGIGLLELGWLIWLAGVVAVSPLLALYGIATGIGRARSQPSADGQAENPSMASWRY